jgi:hypothetical protein
LFVHLPPVQGKPCVTWWQGRFNQWVKWAAAQDSLTLGAATARMSVRSAVKQNHFNCLAFMSIEN